MIHTTRKLIRPSSVVVCIAAFSLFSGDALAQPRWPGTSTQPYKPPATVKSTMVAAERFDDIPDYTGKCKFVRGTKYDKEHSVMYMEILHVQEPRAQVIDWYRNTLSSRGWQVSANKATVGGYKKDSQNSVNVTVNEIPLGDGARCELILQAFRKK